MPEAPTAIDWQLPRRTPARSESKPRVTTTVIPGRRARRCDIAQEYESKIVTRRAPLSRPETLLGARCSLPRRSSVPSAKGRRRSLLVSRASSPRCGLFRRGGVVIPPSPEDKWRFVAELFFSRRRLLREQRRRGRGVEADGDVPVRRILGAEGPRFLGRAEMTERCPPDASD